ncbi:MAG: lysozyme inhibitor LprI family protein [Pseudomonadota bacterium]
MRILMLGFIALFVTLTGQAQEADIQPDWELQAFVATKMCLEGEGPEADRGPECRGIIYEACPENAGSTQEMVECSDAGYRFWDGQLNANYRALVAAYQQEDEFEEADSPYKLVPLLRDAQRAWVAYRDANCKGFERNRFRGGTMGRLSAASCLSSMTADRAQELADLLAETRM